MIEPITNEVTQSQERIPIKTNHLGNKDDTMIFYRGSLAGKLVLVVTMYSLGGSRANWHHTSNP
jgi:hypothetical protein